MLRSLILHYGFVVKDLLGRSISIIIFYIETTLRKKQNFGIPAIGTRTHYRGDCDGCASFGTSGREVQRPFTAGPTKLFYPNNIIITWDFGNILDEDDGDSIRMIMYSRRFHLFPTRNHVAICSHVLLSEREINISK